MPKSITMPMLSPSMSEGTLVKWTKKEGDTIKVGDVIAEVETDKATMDLEAFDSGTILKICVKEGERVPVNALLGYVGKAGEAIPDGIPAATTPAAPTASTSSNDSAAASSSAAPASEPQPSSSDGSRIKASPLAKKIAQAEGIDLSSLQGSGPGGRIVKRDLSGAPATSPKTTASAAHLAVPRQTDPIAKDERIPLSNMRRTIAKRLLESKTQIPHFYVEVEVDAAPLVAFREDLNFKLQHSHRPAKFSFNDFILKASAEAMRATPLLNASFEGDAIRQFGSVHLCFAVAIPDGLLTPVIRDCQAKSIREISLEAKELATRAKEGKLKPEEYMGGTFCVSNLGMMGVERFHAIVNPPQAGILAVGSVVKKPVVNANNEIVVGQRLTITLSCDHRVADGAVAATYLQELKSLLEMPSLLLV